VSSGADAGATGPDTPSDEVMIRPVLGIPEVEPGADLAGLVAEHATDLRDHDIVVVSSKIVSKAEGRYVTVEAAPPDAVESPSAGERPPPNELPAPGGLTTDLLRFAAMRTEAIRSETVRVVAERGAMRIVETRHGFVMAAAGVDASNVVAGSVLLLPVDPDASARALRTALSARLGVTVGVLVTDTFGRPWRLGQTDLAIGAAGVRVIDSYRGRYDAHGNELAVTAPAHGDELAGAAELVKGKVAQVPVAIIRGLPDLVTAEDGPGVRALVRTAEEDMFRLGTREAGREALRSRPRDGLADAPVDADAVRHAVAGIADTTAGHDIGARPDWGLTEVDDPDVRKPLLDAVGLPSSVSYLAVAYIRTHETAEHTSALLALGGLRERLALACALEGVGSAWLTIERGVGAELVRSIVPAEVEAVGLLAVGAALTTGRATAIP
jgi:coenzyme F420-0:L-glutamate ligase / coenzyme F420-1:gamma-L-glutamate ligase